MQGSSSQLEAITARLAVDRLRAAYAVLVLAQMATISLYELGRLSTEVAVIAGLATSMTGPLLSFVVSVHTLRHRRTSRTLDIASVAASYVITCISFAVLYSIISDFNPAAFNQPSGRQGGIDLGTALYFSVVTITTTGYGDISPASGLARAAACWEIVTGLLYQVFIFSLAASLVAAPRADHDPPG